MMTFHMAFRDESTGKELEQYVEARTSQEAEQKLHREFPEAVLIGWTLTPKLNAWWGDEEDTHEEDRR